MQLNITARHVELDDDFKAYVNDKIIKLDRYASKIENARVVFSKESINYVSEITLTGRGIRIVAEEKDRDIRTSFDFCLSDIEKQLKKLRGKTKSHRIKNFFQAFRLFSGRRKELPKPEASIIKAESFATKPMSAEEAALELEALDRNFIVFHNSADNKVNVIYKRKDGNYGLIET